MLIVLRILTLHCSLEISRKTGDNIVIEKKQRIFRLCLTVFQFNSIPFFFLGKFNQRPEETVKIRHILNMTSKSEFQTLVRVQLLFIILLGLKTHGCTSKCLHVGKTHLSFSSVTMQLSNARDEKVGYQRET